MNRIINQDGARVSALPVVIYTDLELNLYCVKAGDVPAQSFRDPARLFWWLRSTQRRFYPRITSDGGRLPLLCAFVNNLKAFTAALYQEFPEAQQEGVKKSGEKEAPLQIVTPVAIFRSFDAVSNSTPATVAKMFRTENRLEAMAKLLDELAGGKPWCKIRWSLAYEAKKAFYKDMRAALWEIAKEQKILYKSLQSYRDMFCGNKAGLLCLYNAPEHAAKLRQIFGNIESWDKKSAYPSVIVSDALFPLGAPLRIVREKVDVLKARIRERQWFKVVITSRKRIPELDIFEGEPENRAHRYGVEWYDWRVLTECLEVSQKRICEILNASEWALYISPETGCLPDCLRWRIVELYTEKEIYSKDSPRRFFLKTQIDMIVGKGLQWRDFQNVSQVNAHYIGRGENYLQPQHSMHCIAKVRYEIMCIIKQLGEDAISWDTDGLKARAGKVAQIMKERNENIISLNWLTLGRKHGFSCNIGVWDFEGRGDFMPISAKSYLFQPEGGRLVFKHCGITDDDIAAHLRGVRQNIFTYFQKPREIKTKGGYIYYTRNRKYSREATAFTL